MRGTMMVTAMALLVAGPAHAAPLCRDSKGLFTPCVGTPARAYHRPDPEREAATLRDAALSDAPADRPARTHPPLVARARSCRDAKGLYTPCPR